MNFAMEDDEPEIVASIADSFERRGEAAAIAEASAEGSPASTAMMLVDVAVAARNQRGDTTAQADATISLPSRELGAAMLPRYPRDLQRDGLRRFERHGELLRSHK
jgi:carbon monoxide dehydrogenase subunit G